MHWGAFCAVLVSLAAAPSFGAQVVSPQRYDLMLNVNATSSTFTGTVDITGQVSTQTNVLELRTSGLNINSVGILQSSQSVTSHSVDKNTETLTITLDSSLLTTAQFVVSISFSGSLSSDQSGLYTFVDNGQEYLVTNLYPAYARRLFPCFDDPNAKAAFKLTLSTTLPSGAQVISNTGVLRSSNNAGGVTTTVFNITPVIPPSSLFFIVGSLNNFYSTDSTTIWMTPTIMNEPINSDIYTALNSDIFRKFHQLDGMPKLDIIVIPQLKSRSYSGYGVVVYREDALVVDYTKSTTAMIRESTVTILEALFKIFYGTLTSPASWAENYISDSVATYLSYQSIKSFSSSASLEPSRASDYFFADISSKALDLCTTSTAVIGPTTLSMSSDIEAFVMGPSMLKGAAILQTVSSIFPNMTDGLFNCYSSTKQQATGVTTAAFFQCLDTFRKSATNSLSVIIGPWLSNGGCPLVATERRDSAVYIVQQQIPETSSLSLLAATVSPLQVPVTSQSNATGFNNDGVVYLSNNFNAPSQLAATIGPNNWFVIDVDGQGYYRTQYDTKSWSTLTESLASNISVVSSATRSKILSDSFFVAREIDYTLYKTLPNSLNFLTKERYLAPWQITIENWRHLWNWIYHTGTPSISQWEQNISLNFTNYAIGLMLNTFNELHVQEAINESFDTKTLRSEIVGAMCDFGQPLCLSSTQSQFQNWLNGATVSSDMLPVIVCNGLKSSTYDNPDSWRGIYNILSPNNQIDDNIRNVIYKTMACVSPSNSATGDSNSINEYLSMVLLNSGNGIPIEDVPMAFKAIYSRPEHTTQALNFFLTNQPANLRKDLVQTTQVSMMNDLAQYLTLDSQASLLTTFVTNNVQTVNTDFLASVKAAQATLQATTAWIRNVQSQLHAGLDPNFTPPNTPPTSAPAPGGSTNNPPGGSTTPVPDGAGTYTPCIALLFVTLFAFIF